MAFEQDGELWKLNALLAGAMMDYGGWAWNADLGEYTPLMGSTDSADLMERAWSNILKPAEFTRVRLYEKASPPGQAPPSPYPVEAPLERWESVDEWQENAFGLVKVAGHGDARNVYRNVWAVDYLADGQVQNPTEPIGGRTGKPKTLLPPQLQRARDLTPHPPQSGHKAAQLDLFQSTPSPPVTLSERATALAARAPSCAPQSQSGTVWSSNVGDRARASGGTSGSIPIRSRLLRALSGSFTSPTNRILPPQGHSKGSTSHTRLSKVAQSNLCGIR